MLNRSLLAYHRPCHRFIWLVPTIWMVSLSFGQMTCSKNASTTTLSLVPIPFTADNYAALFAFGQTPTWFLNSVIVALGMTLGVLAVSTTAGHALARQVSIQEYSNGSLLDWSDGPRTGGLHSALHDVRRLRWRNGYQA